MLSSWIAAQLLLLCVRKNFSLSPWLPLTTALAWIPTPSRYAEVSGMMEERRKSCNPFRSHTIMNKVSCYVLTQRLLAGLGQEELRALLPRAGRNRVSTIERELHPPNGGEILAYEVIFGLPARELFPKRYAEIEEEIIDRAYALHRKLEGKNDKKSVQKRAFLEAILARAVDRRAHKGI